MTMNLNQTRVIDPVLTTVALGYQNAEFVGGVLFPRVPVEISGGQVLQFGKEAFMSYNLRRAPGSSTKRAEFGYLGAPFALINEAIDVPIPREMQRDASIMPGIDLGTRAVNVGMRIVGISLEIAQAALAVNAANYDGAHKITLAGVSKWSNAASDPVAQIDTGRDAVRSTVGRYPNTLLLSPVAFTAIKNNPNVKARFQYVSANSITEDMLAKLLNIDTVVTAKAIQSDDTGAFTDVWGNNALLAWVPPAVEAQVETPSYGYTYTMQGHPLVEVPFWDPNTKSWVYGVAMERQPVITAPNAGYLIQTPN